MSYFKKRSHLSCQMTVAQPNEDFSIEMNKEPFMMSGS